MVNVRALSFARTMHHEATKPPSVTAHGAARECKELSAPGEVPPKALSDAGSTPAISTNGKRVAVSKGTAALFAKICSPPSQQGSNLFRVFFLLLNEQQNYSEYARHRQILFLKEVLK